MCSDPKSSAKANGGLTVLLWLTRKGIEHMLNTNSALAISAVDLLLYASLELLNDKSRAGSCESAGTCFTALSSSTVTDSSFRLWAEVNLVLPNWLKCPWTYFVSGIRTVKTFRYSAVRRSAAILR